MPRDTVLNVKAAEGLTVPRHDNPRRYIGAEATAVPASSYYRRLIADGSLVDCDAPKDDPKAKKPKADDDKKGG